MIFDGILLTILSTAADWVLFTYILRFLVLVPNSVVTFCEKLIEKVFLIMPFPSRYGGKSEGHPCMEKGINMAVST